MEQRTNTGNNRNEYKYFAMRLHNMLMESLIDGLAACELENPCLGLMENIEEVKERLDAYVKEKLPGDETLPQCLEELLRYWDALMDEKNRRAYFLGYRDSMRIYDILWPREALGFN